MKESKSIRILCILLLLVLCSGCGPSAGEITADSIINLGYAKTEFALIQEEITNSTEEIQISKLLDKCNKVHAYLQNIKDTSIEGYTDFASMFYYQAGIWASMENDTIALTYFSKIPENKPNHAWTQVLTTIESGNTEAAMELMPEFAAEERYIFMNLLQMAIKQVYPVSNLEESLTYATNAASTNSALFDIARNPKYYKDIDYSQVYSGMYADPESYTLNAEDRDMLLSTCGTNPEKKILVLHKRKVYNQAEIELDIHLKMLKYIPVQYIPQNIQEVEYIILMESDWYESKEYMNTDTKGIGQTAKITVYKIGKAEPIYESIVLSEPAPFSFSYPMDNLPPDFVTGGYPDASKIIVECLNAIFTNIRK